MTIKRFKFKLKKVSTRQGRLLDAMFEYLPATGIREGLIRKGIGDAFRRHIGEDASFHFEAVHQETFSTFTSKLPDPAIVAVIGMSPLNKKALCEVDPMLAVTLIERLLGDKTTSIPRARQLSDTEQGVLQYFFLQVLASVYRTCGNSPRVHFRFDKFALDAHMLRELAEPNDGVAVLVFRVKIGKQAGFVRLAFPDPFVEETFLNVESSDEMRIGERNYRLQAMSKFAYVRFPLWAEAGRTTLTPAELSQIEEGDVVLLDESEVALYDGKPSGQVALRVGEGNHGGFEAELDVDKKRAHCKIVGFRAD